MHVVWRACEAASLFEELSIEIDIIKSNIKDTDFKLAACMDANCTFPKWTKASNGSRWLTGGAVMAPKANHTVRMQADLIAWMESHRPYVPSTFAV